MSGVEWSVRQWWEKDGNVLCSERRAPTQNRGRAIKVRRYIDPADGALVVTQEWLPGRVYTQRLMPEVAGVADTI